MDLLDEHLERTNKLGKFICPNLEELEYWEIRMILPYLLEGGYGVLSEYFKEKYNTGKFDNPNAISFFYYIYDELRRISELESRHITFKQDTNVIHSPRAREFPHLMELAQLSGFCPIKAEQIKKMKYGDIFDMLLAQSIDSEKQFKKP